MLARIKSLRSPSKTHKRRPAISAPIPIPTLQPQPVTQEDAWATLAAAYEAKAARSPASSISSAPSSCHSRESSSSSSSSETLTCRRSHRPRRRQSERREPEPQTVPWEKTPDTKEGAENPPARVRSSSATSWGVLHELIDDCRDDISIISHTSIVTDYEEGQFAIKRAEVVSL